MWTIRENVAATAPATAATLQFGLFMPSKIFHASRRKGFRWIMHGRHCGRLKSSGYQTAVQRTSEPPFKTVAGITAEKKKEG